MPPRRRSFATVVAFLVGIGAWLRRHRRGEASHRARPSRQSRRGDPCRWRCSRGVSRRARRPACESELPGGSGQPPARPRAPVAKTRPNRPGITAAVFARSASRGGSACFRARSSHARTLTGRQRRHVPASVAGSRAQSGRRSRLQWWSPVARRRGEAARPGQCAGAEVRRSGRAPWTRQRPRRSSPRGRGSRLHSPGTTLAPAPDQGHRAVCNSTVERPFRATMP
jgi:hypothetical protein